jgi:hypothetical protein
VVELPEYLENNELMEIIIKGAFLCKENTQKLKNLNNVPIIYTKIKNVLKTKTNGAVLTTNTKSIIC